LLWGTRRGRFGFPRFQYGAKQRAQQSRGHPLFHGHLQDNSRIDLNCFGSILDCTNLVYFPALFAKVIPGSLTSSGPHNTPLSFKREAVWYEKKGELSLRSKAFLTVLTVFQQSQPHSTVGRVSSSFLNFVGILNVLYNLIGNTALMGVFARQIPKLNVQASCSIVVVVVIA
jgi:hypothetical protein